MCSAGVKQTSMALNVPGVIAVVLFYVLILATGIWAARKSRKAEGKSHGDQAEVVLLGDRSISLPVGIFTMTGTLARGSSRSPGRRRHCAASETPSGHAGLSKGALAVFTALSAINNQ